MLSTYLSTRKLSNILFLFDIRRNIESYELEYMKSFHENGVNIAVVLTKADKLKTNEQRKKKQEMLKSLESFGIEKNQVVSCSTLKKTGIEELRKRLFTSLSD